MCGVVAELSGSEYTVLTSLKKLEYRGSDSNGTGTFQGKIKKRLGRIRDEYIELASKDVVSCIIGQNRWASVGEISLKNAHPILSFDQNILLCHNGTVTNHEKVAEQIKLNHGITNRGETDTETITNWLALNFDSNPDEYKRAYEEFVKTFEGTWAIVFIHRASNKIFFLVKDLPLYYYNGKLSSDQSVFPFYYALPNNSYGYIYSLDSVYFDSNPDLITNKRQLSLNGQNLYVDGSYQKNADFVVLKEKCKGPEEDKMLKEIGEQATLDYHLDRNGKEFLALWNKFDFESVKLFGMGSSYNAAVLGKRYFESYNIDSSMDYASEYNYRGKGDTELKIAISQSGETADVSGVLSKLANTRRLLVTNKHHCTCGMYATSIHLDIGVEESVAATKTFTATTLNLLTFAKYSYGDFNLDFEKILKENIAKVLENSLEISQICDTIKDFKNSFILGTGPYYGVVREGALKIKEVGNIQCEAMPVGENKHGSLALQSPEMLNIVILGDKRDYLFEEKYKIAIGNCQQIKSRGGVLIGIGPERIKEFDHFIKAPELRKHDPFISPLIHNVITQLFSYYLAKKKGLNCDSPKFLAKALTVY